jgi:hypothetical protein
MSIRQHGTLAMRRRGECATNPCDLCLDAGRRYERRRTKLKTMGRSPYVDATPTRTHIQKLLTSGMSVRQIEAASGINRTAIRCIIGDFPGRKPSKGIRPATENSIQAVRANLGPIPGGTATVDGAGTRRRIQALQAIGYPTRYLAQRLGAGPTSQLQIARRNRVRASTARDVAALYALLESTPGPSHRVAITAQARGFLAPAWWDADTIDDPNTEPDGLRTYEQWHPTHGRSRTIVREALFDDSSTPRLARIELLLSRGLTRSEVAARLGVPLRYVTRDILNGAAT